jgi:hypothetical protein
MAQVDAEKGLGIELNRLEPVEGGCRLTFLATNGLGTELARAGIEVALFGADGGSTDWWRSISRG